MAETEIDSQPASDSMGDSGQDTSVDTAPVQGHTEAPVNEASSHLDWLKANTDKLSDEDRKALDRTFQPDYTRRVNNLNLFKQNATQAFKEAGVEIPDNIDLFGPDGGKQLKDLVSSTIQRDIGPVKEAINKAEMSQNINREIGRARQLFPEVNENLEEAVRRVDSDADLTEMSMAYGGKAIPYVLRYAALEIVREKQAKEIKELRARMDGAKIATKVGGSSTKSTGAGGKGDSASAKSDGPKSGMSLEKAYRRAALAALESNKS